jgi:hypothetical protein
MTRYLSAAEWRQDHSEHRASAIALEQKLSLMLAHDCLLYEQVQPRMRFEPIAG